MKFLGQYVEKFLESVIQNPLVATIKIFCVALIILIIDFYLNHMTVAGLLVLFVCAIYVTIFLINIYEIAYPYEWMEWNEQWNIFTLFISISPIILTYCLITEINRLSATQTSWYIAGLLLAFYYCYLFISMKLKENDIE